MQTTDFLSTSHCLAFFDRRRLRSSVQRLGDAKPQAAVLPDAGHQVDGRPIGDAIFRPAGNSKASKGGRLIPSLQQTEDSRLEVEAWRRSRLAAGSRGFDAIDEQANSIHAGQRSRSQTVGQLFASMVEDSRSSNRRQHFKNRQAEQRLEKSTEVICSGHAGGRQADVLPQAEDAGRTMADRGGAGVGREPKPVTGQPQESIVVKRMTPDTIARLESPSQGRQNTTCKIDGRSSAGRQAVGDLVVLEKRLRNDGARDGIEIVFCPKSEKQPKLKLVMQPTGHRNRQTPALQAKPSTPSRLPVKRPSTGDHLEPVKSPKASPQLRTAADHRSEKLSHADMPDEKRQTGGQPGEAKVRGGFEHVTRLQAARLKRMTGQPQTGMTVKPGRPKSGRHKVERFGEVFESPADKLERGETRKSMRESSPEPVDGDTAEQRGPLFKIELPKMAPKLAGKFARETKAEGKSRSRRRRSQRSRKEDKIV